VSDGAGNTATETLTITVDRPPTAGNNSAAVANGNTVSANVAGGALANSADSDGDGLVITGVTNSDGHNGNPGESLIGTYGHLTLNANGSYSYVADNADAIANAPAGSHPTDFFAYTVSDGHGGTTKG